MAPETSPSSSSNSSSSTHDSSQEIEVPLPFEPPSISPPSPPTAAGQATTMTRLVGRKIVYALRFNSSKHKPSTTKPDPLSSSLKHILSTPRSSDHLPSYPPQPYTITMELLEYPNLRKQIEKLEGSEAQCVVDFLHEIISSGSAVHGKKTRILSVLSKIAQQSHIFPSRCRIEGVKCDLKDPPKHEGGYGVVYQGRYQRGSVCVKAIHVGRDQPNLVQALAKELILWTHLSHPNVAPLYGVYRSKEANPRICLVSPWMKNGDLRHYLNACPSAPRSHLLSDVAKGLQYLHESNIIHRDLKADNILISDSGRAMITDFGISSVNVTKVSAVPTNGTPWYKSPELSTADPPIPATKESDVWSFGCICYEAFLQEQPFQKYSPVQLVAAFMVKQAIPLRPEDEFKVALPEMVKLMKWCWDYNPTKRPTCEEIQIFLAEIGEIDDRSPDVSRRNSLEEVERARSAVKTNYERVDDILHRIATAPNFSNRSTGEITREQPGRVDEDDIRAIDRELAGLLKDQLEFFIRIKSINPDQAVDCPVVNSMVSRDRRRDLLQCICNLLRTKVNINGTHLSAIENVLGLEFDLPDPEVQLFNEALLALQGWIRDNPSGTDSPRDNAPPLKLLGEVIKLERRVHLLRRIVKNRHESPSCSEDNMTTFLKLADDEGGIIGDQGDYGVETVPPVDDVDNIIMDGSQSQASRDMRRDLLQCVCRLMQSNIDIRETHLSVIEHVLELESDMHNPIIQLFDDALSALQEWIAYTQDQAVDLEPEANAARQALLGRAIKSERRVHLLRRITKNRPKT